MADSNLITILGTVITAAAAIIVATIQVNKSFRTSYKIEAYKNISDKIKEFLEKHSRYIASLALLHGRHQMILEGKPVSSTLGNYSFNKLLDEMNDVVDATTEIIHLIDIYKIVCPGFDKYQQALKASFYAVHNEGFTNLLLQFQPRKDGDLSPPAKPGEREKLITAIGEQINRITTLFWEVDDFSVAAQNTLMGDVFGNKIDYRSPPGERTSPVIRIETPFFKKHKRFLIMLLGTALVLFLAS